jgi:hypothetical protein
MRRSESIKWASRFAILALLFFAIETSLRAATPIALAGTTQDDTPNLGLLLHTEPVVGCSIGEGFDTVIPPLLPPGWIALNTIDPDGILWQTSDSGDPSPPALTPPNAVWINDPDMISDKHLDSPSLVIDPHTSSAILAFSHNYALEDGFDGGVLEVSVNGGLFQDIIAVGGFFKQGGYNGTISTCCGSPLAGRQAWTGNSGGFVDTEIELPVVFGKPFVLRWRMASDSNGSDEGWRVDNVDIMCERPTPSPPPITPTPTPTPTATPRATPRARPTPHIRPTP